MPAKNQTVLPAVVVVLVVVVVVLVLVVIVVVVVITVQVAFAVMFSDPWTALRAPGAYDYAVICGQGAKSSMEGEKATSQKGIYKRQEVKQTDMEI